MKQMKLRSLIKKVSVLARARIGNSVNDAAISKEVAMYHQIAALYDALTTSSKVANAHELALENYRAAANLRCQDATYTVGFRLMERGKFYQSLYETHLSNKAQLAYAKAAFDEAFSYLRAADEAVYPRAKRLMGLAYIRGYGVTQDWSKGADLIKDSITQANAWGEASQIFAELGISGEPDVLSKIMAGKN